MAEVRAEHCCVETSLARNIGGSKTSLLRNAAVKGTMMPSDVIIALLLGLCALFIVRAWRQHRWFVKEKDVFRCYVRLVTGWVPGFTHEWRGRPGWGRWVHDVLIFRSSGLRGRTYYLPVHTVVGSVRTAAAGRVGRLGRSPVIAQVRLDVDDVLEIAAPSSAHDLVAGPFLVAGALGDRGSTEGRPPKR